MLINIYQGSVFTKGGNVVKTDEIRAANKREAAKKLKLEVIDIDFIRHERRQPSEVVDEIFITQHPALAPKAARVAVKNMSVGIYARRAAQRPVKRSRKAS